MDEKHEPNHLLNEYLKSHEPVLNLSKPGALDELRAEIAKLGGNPFFQKCILYEQATREAEAILGNEYGMRYGPFFDLVEKARSISSERLVEPQLGG